MLNEQLTDRLDHIQTGQDALERRLDTLLARLPTVLAQDDAHSETSEADLKACVTLSEISEYVIRNLHSQHFSSRDRHELDLLL